MIDGALDIREERVVNEHVVCCAKKVWNICGKGVRNSIDEGSRVSRALTKLDSVYDMLLLIVEDLSVWGSFYEMSTHWGKGS